MREAPGIEELTKELREIKEILAGTYRRWLPLKEAAAYAGVSAKKLKQLIETGEIRAKKLDGKWIVDRLSIDEFYESDWVELKNALREAFK